MLGEADHHSPEEQAILGQGQHGEAGGSAEETKEVQLANQILAAVKSGDKQAVIQAASELIRMHDPKTKASYDREMQVGTITPQQFQTGEPWWAHRKHYHRTKPVSGMTPMPKKLTMSMMTGVPSQSYPSSP